MGREVKRVALDFDWPVKKAWPGYINPHYKECPEAGRTCFNGSNAAACYLGHITDMLTVIGGDAQRGETHPYARQLPYHMDHPEWSIQPKEIRQRMVGLIQKLTDDDGDFLGFTGKGHTIFFKLLEMAGIKNPPYENSKEYDEAKKPAYEWTNCLACKGESIDPAVQGVYDAWKRSEPPEGTGWQMWENTSEGSPISPVFKTPEALARWLTDSEASAFGKQTASYDAWLSMIVGPGTAPSAISTPGKGIISGVEGIHDSTER